MRNLVLLMGAILISGIIMLLSNTSDATAADKPEKLLRHIVLYKFKDSVSKDQIKEVIDAFAALPKQIPTIVDFEHGPNVSKEGKSDGLSYAFVVTFKSESDLASYIKDPAHQAYVDVVKDRREKVVVVDYWTGE